ncbi:hypothetical protein BB558_001563 [Smittium angustum]|nr:hypothetical protein BB558_001563 [Smittium angustum]
MECSDEKQYPEEYHELLRELIGPQYAFPLIRKSVEKEFLQEVYEKISSQRPKHRVVSDPNLFYGEHAFITLDASYSDSIEDYYTIEFKPKCGFVPTSEYISKDKLVKKKVCRFCLYKNTRFPAKESKDLYEYCPLQLYSSDVNMIRKGVEKLFGIEKPIFKCFKNGISYMPIESIKNELIEKTTIVIQQTKLLKKLVFLQRSLDSLDIEGVKRLADENQIDCSKGLEMGIDVYKQTISTFIDRMSQGKQESEDFTQVINEFYLSTSLKDVSIMITISKSKCEDSIDLRKGDYYKFDSNMPDWEEYIDEKGDSFYARIVSIDLDTKHHKSIDEYYNKDSKIVDGYVKKREAESGLI